MAIHKNETREIARLARLALTDDEVERLTVELGNILGYIEKLQALDVSGVEGTTHAVPMDCPLREDVVGGQLPTEDALRGAPKREEDFFAVPAIIEVGE